MASMGRSLLASAPKDMVMAFGYLISGSFAQAAAGRQKNNQDGYTANERKDLLIYPFSIISSRLFSPRAARRASALSVYL